METGVIAVDPSTHSSLETMIRRGHAEFNCVAASGEPRILLITRKNIKVRSRLSRITTTSSTIYKQGYEMPLTLTIDPISQVLRRPPCPPHPPHPRRLPVLPAASASSTLLARISRANAMPPPGVVADGGDVAPRSSHLQLGV